MERFKRFIKTILIIFGFLLVNILIDVFTGLTIPNLIASLKDGDLLKADRYIIYGVFFGQLIKLVILYFYICKRDKTFKRKLNRSYILREKVLQPLNLVGIGLGTIGFGQFLTNLIMEAFAGTQALNSAMQLLANAFNPKGVLDGIIILLAVVIGAPLVEELLFRGVLFEEIKRLCSLRTTIFLTGLIFACYHFNIIQSPNTFFMGLVLAYVYYRTKSIKASIIVHATNNILAMVPFLDQGLTPLGIFINAVLLVVGIYSLLALRRKA